MEDVKQLLARASEWHRIGKLAEAEALYLQILEGKPDQFEAWHLLGMLRFQQGRLDEALASMEAALKARPGAAGTLMLHGAILHALQRHEEALQSLVKAALARPDYAPAHYLRGNVLATLKRRRLAEAHGFVVEAMDTQGVRNESGIELPNYITVLRCT